MSELLLTVRPSGKPLFSEKHNISRNITLVEGDRVVSKDSEVADIMNNFFSSVVQNLENLNINEKSNDPVGNAVDKFKNQPSIQKIKERVNVGTKFKFSLGSEDSMRSVINELNINKPTTYNNIPAKILVDNVDICSHYITETYNHAVLNCTFPDALKMADITPVYKKR